MPVKRLSPAILPRSSRYHVEPPTIGPEASEVAARGSAGDAAQPGQPPPPRPPRSRVFTAVIAAITGAAAAALVIAATTLAGWPEPPPAAPAPPPANSAAIDELTARVAGIEAKISQPVTSSPAPAADPALAGRVEELEKSVAALRGQLDGLHTQSEQLAAAVNEVKSAPRDTPPSADVTGINERIAESNGLCTRRLPRSPGKAPSKTPNRRTIRRCAASWRQLCSTCWSGPAILSPPRLRRRNRLPPIRIC